MQQLAQRANVLARRVVGQHAHGQALGDQVDLVPALGRPGGGLDRARAAASLASLALRRIAQLDGLARQLDKAVRVKVGVGDGGKERLGDKEVGLWVADAALARLDAIERDALEQPDDQVLQRRDLGGLAAHAARGASLAPGRFLALIAKHVHDSLPLENVLDRATCRARAR